MSTPQDEAVSDFMERHFKHLRDGRREYTEAEVRAVMLGMQTEFDAQAEALAAVTRERDALRASQWLPISTAPKDGSEIILRRGSRVGAGMWCKWPATEYEEAGEGWTIGFDGDSWDEDKAPTEWQPLPLPSDLATLTPTAPGAQEQA